ncbi:NAD(P)-dependent alcohol dehydrogenase [Blastococcus sp. VKM Ac-2987]|uniref:NAD(P)-dependent alcohol dehydrogenase n=1 Tax=Blastococcus sp. VKM Ac-2987 TaxID=3004141 RepID=UPI0022AB6F72|nr:NAD(P)-dependent alcohol dehydrogenase [Blastococcus sp. VKM Ac-2987]MCZ2857475.1 NAD(P)-dependent alcohol dehydrogenase [Blastococcus sp. VKM Ac-2987]
MPTTTTTRSTTMRAVVQDEYGGAEVLRLRDMPIPSVADDEVLVRARAAGVDRGVVHLMTGLPYPVRLAGYGVRVPKNPVPGGDVAGVVEAVGTAVTRFRPGDAVLGIGTGAFAEYVRAPEAKLVHKPAALTFVQAAALPVSGLTALQAVRDHANIQPGQHVLVLGASGGVGTYAVQLAKARAATVTGVCRTAKTDLVRALGADHVVDYTRTNPTDGSRRYDQILDIGGNTPLRSLRRALTPTGRLTIIGGETGGRWLGGFERALRAPLVSLFVRQDLGKPWVCSEKHADLAVLVEHVAAGHVAPAVDRTFPLHEAATAVRHLIDGRAAGKVVITIDPAVHA